MDETTGVLGMAVKKNSEIKYICLFFKLIHSRWTAQYIYIFKNFHKKIRIISGSIL